MFAKKIVIINIFLALAMTLSCGRLNLWSTLDPQPAAKTYKYFLYFGNNVGGAPGDIYRYEIDMSTGSLSTVIPSGLGFQNGYLAVSPSQKILYSTAALLSGVFSYVVNSPDGSLDVQTIWIDGTFSPDYTITVHPNGNFLIGASAGGGQIYNVKIMPDGTLFPGPTPNSIGSPTIDGITGFAIKPTGDFIYVSNQNPPGNLNQISIDQLTGAIAVPASTSTTHTLTSIVIHPTLQYLYVAYTTVPRIIVYSINGSGALTPTGATVPITQDGPTSLVIDPTGNFLYCLSSYFPAEISGYRINQSVGSLSVLAGSPYTIPDRPGITVDSYMTIDPTGNYLYVPLKVTGFVDGYSINHTTGELTYIGNQSYPGVNAANPVIIKVQQ